MVEVALPKTKAPVQTFEEAYYLKKLVESQAPVRVRLVTGEQVEGLVEYWDAGFIRLTCAEGPNLFIYKEQIRYVEEIVKD
jgi:sRNA-binding regulator protein Hfq